MDLVQKGGCSTDYLEAETPLGLFAILTVPLPPVLKICAAIRLAANTGFIFHIPYEKSFQRDM